MLEKDKLFNVLLAALYAVTVSSLAAIGEQRFDAYFSLLTLEYAVLYALLRPKRRWRELLLPVLLAIFAYFVALRVLEVLGL